ncbi:8653_t:CDS:2, partial [Gigaspora rosea]
MRVCSWYSFKAADDNRIIRIFIVTLHNSRADFSKFPFHQDIGSSLFITFQAKLKSNIGERNARKQQEQLTSYHRRGRSPYKFDKTNYSKGGFYNGQENTKLYIVQSTLSALVQSKITRERSSQHKQSRHEQQTNEEHSTSPFQTSGQILASCDNSAANIKRKNTFNAPKIDATTSMASKNSSGTEAQSKQSNSKPPAKSSPQGTNGSTPDRSVRTEEGKKSKTYKAIVQIRKWTRIGKKNQNQKIDTNLKKEMLCSIRKINKKLNIEIAGIETSEILSHTKEHFISQFKGESLNLEEMPDKWKSIYKPKDHVQENIYHSVNE